MRKLFLMALLAVGMSANAQFLEDKNNEFGNVGGVNLGDGVDENDSWTLHVNFGVNVPTSVPDDIEFAPFRSWEIGVTVLQYDYTPKNWKTTFSAGLGFDWRNYRMTDRMFVKEPDGKIQTYNYPAGTEPKFSRIHTFSLSFPLKYYHYFNKKMYFAIGPELYITPWASLKTKYYENGEEQKITAGNIHENTVSLGVGAEINIHHIGIYYKYNPFNVLSSSFGPGFASMTTGIKIAF